MYWKIIRRTGLRSKIFAESPSRCFSYFLLFLEVILEIELKSKKLCRIPFSLCFLLLHFPLIINQGTGLFVVSVREKREWLLEMREKPVLTGISFPEQYICLSRPTKHIWWFIVMDSKTVILITFWLIQGKMSPLSFKAHDLTWNWTDLKGMYNTNTLVMNLCHADLKC